MTTELNVMQALAERLAVISTGNGYGSDAGAQVFVFRDGFSVVDRPPWLAVVFEEREPRDAASRFIGCPQFEARASFLIVGAVQLDEASRPDNALTLLDDIDTALMHPSAQAAFRAVGITVMPGMGMCLPHEEGDAHTEITVRVTVDYAKTYA